MEDSTAGRIADLSGKPLAVSFLTQLQDIERANALLSETDVSELTEEELQAACHRHIVLRHNVATTGAKLAVELGIPVGY